MHSQYSQHSCTCKVRPGQRDGTTYSTSNHVPCNSYFHAKFRHGCSYYDAESGTVSLRASTTTMAPPPSVRLSQTSQTQVKLTVTQTPASKFIFRRPQGRGAPLTASSPRFVTPRVTNPPATPTPSQLFLASSARRGYTDEIESSPPESPSSPVTDRGELAEHESASAHGRGRKRRRVSRSPEDDGLSRECSLPPPVERVQKYKDEIESSSPSSPLSASEDVGHHAHLVGSGDDKGLEKQYVERTLTSDRISVSPDSETSQISRGAEKEVSRDAIVDADDNTEPLSEPSPDTDWETRPHPRQPEFHAPPPFKPPDLRVESHLEGLPQAFSPQRRGAKHVPEGLAAEVQGWLSHIKGSRETGPGLRLLVKEVREGGMMYVVRGRELSASGEEDWDNAKQDELRVLLAGEGEMTGLGKAMRVTEGCVVDAGRLRWNVELDGLGWWIVACDWRVVEDSVS